MYQNRYYPICGPSHTDKKTHMPRVIFLEYPDVQWVDILGIALTIMINSWISHLHSKLCDRMIHH